MHKTAQCICTAEVRNDQLPSYPRIPGCSEPGSCLHLQGHLSMFSPDGLLVLQQATMSPISSMPCLLLAPSLGMPSSSILGKLLFFFQNPLQFFWQTFSDHCMINYSPLSAASVPLHLDHISSNPRRHRF